MKKNFSSPVIASNYSAGLGTVCGAELQSIDYVNGSVSWRPLDNAGARIGTAIFGTNAEDITEDSAAARIRAEIDATNE